MHMLVDRSFSFWSRLVLLHWLQCWLL